MGYTTLLFDLDHTLVDSDASEIAAYAHTMATIGLDRPDDHFERYLRINQALWAEVERGDVQPSEVRHRRFQQFVGEVELDADPMAMADAFVWGLGAHGELYDGAREMLERLAGSTRMALVTNGLGEVQRARLERLDLARYFDVVVISSEVGVTKPRPRIFEIAFELLDHPDKRTSLMIGDSLTSDIRGGGDFGIDTCWFNWRKAPPSDGFSITHEIADLASLIAIVDAQPRPSQPTVL